MKQLITLSAFLFCATFSFAQGKPEGLFINSRAADFKGKDQSGMEVSLRDLRKKGPVVVVFYRGNWDPYDNRYLSRLQDSLQYITEKGAAVVAISPEGSEGVAKTVEKTKAVFSILSDVDMKTANAYRGAYQVDERGINRYKMSGIDLLQTNGQKEKAYLPVPAVYVVNKEGSVIYRFFEEDYKKRPSVREIVSEIK